MLDFDSCYEATASRDSRFDGQFFTAVTTTGIYCRPSCPAISPQRKNVTFFSTNAAAHHAGFRACRRCLPDAVPGSPEWNTNSNLAARAMRLINDGVIERDGVDGLAAKLGYSTRHITRIVTEQFGAGPKALASAQRSTTARLLIQNTSMPFSDIAFAAGFASIRQFNDSIKSVFSMTPTQMRAVCAPYPQGSSITLKLPVRQPFNTTWSRWFLQAHVIDGIEHFADDTYSRTVSLPHGPAAIAP